MPTSHVKLRRAMAATQLQHRHNKRGRMSTCVETTHWQPKPVAVVKSLSISWRNCCKPSYWSTAATHVGTVRTLVQFPKFTHKRFWAHGSMKDTTTSALSKVLSVIYIRDNALETKDTPKFHTVWEWWGWLKFPCCKRHPSNKGKRIFFIWY